MAVIARGAVLWILLWITTHLGGTTEPVIISTKLSLVKASSEICGCIQCAHQSFAWVNIFYVGNFIVQTANILLSTCGLFLLTFSTWQLTLDQPHCCSQVNSSSLSLVTFLDRSVGVTPALKIATNCSELNKVTFLEQLGFGISPAVNITLAIIGLVVSNILIFQCH